MQMAGLEPAPRKPGHEPESCAYANSATSADLLEFRFVLSSLARLKVYTILMDLSTENLQIFFKKSS